MAGHLLFFLCSFLCIFKCILSKPLVFAHWMPWFDEYPTAYHWPPRSGTYYLPLIGYYSSKNETVMEWQIELMQKSGIDGIIVDWYGAIDKYGTYCISTESTKLVHF